MAITVKHKNENDESSTPMFGENPYVEYSAKVTFPALVLESLTGKTPSAQDVKLFNLILNLGFDNGPGSPSASATIASSKEDKPMGEAVAAGVAQLNEKHGGAGEPLMELMYNIKDGKTNPEKAVKDLIAEGKRLPGFGHRIYKDKDPRAQLLLETARQEGIGVEFIEILEQLREQLNTQSGKGLPINVDGAIAAVFCGLKLEPKLGLAVYIIARTPGLIAHFLNNS